MTPHRCSVCENEYSTLGNLRRHTKKFHPDNVVPFRYNRSQNRFRCTNCEKSYHCKQTLQRHIKTRHSNTNEENATLTSNLKKNTTATVTITRNSKKCPLCSWCYNCKSQMLAHFKDIHEVPIRCEQFMFSSFEAFNRWKSNMENETNSRFIKRSTKKLESHTCITYVCHRSGNYLPEGKGRRRLKTKGSNKINACCPSSIKITIKNDKSVKAEFLETHIGHEAQVGHLQITTLERRNIAAKIASKLSFDEGIDDGEGTSGIASDLHIYVSHNGDDESKEILSELSKKRKTNMSLEERKKKNLMRIQKHLDSIDTESQMATFERIVALFSPTSAAADRMIENSFPSSQKFALNKSITIQRLWSTKKKNKKLISVCKPKNII